MITENTYGSKKNYKNRLENRKKRRKNPKIRQIKDGEVIKVEKEKEK